MTEPQPMHQRVAADLRLLANLAEQHPPLGVELGYSMQRVAIILPVGSQVGVDTFDGPLRELGAVEVPTQLVDARWPARTWQLPAEVIALTVTRFTGGDL